MNVAILHRCSGKVLFEADVPDAREKPRPRLAVNGPPGIGKTTLLRDIVAPMITERAKVMREYEDPEYAFSHWSRQRTGNNWFLDLYQLDPALKGCEIIVASSNNKAVENVSAQLPGLEAIDDTGKTLRYFKTASDNLLNKETWGACAAVLGNSNNRWEFLKKFWEDKDFGLRTYLLECAGSPQHVGKEIRKPKIVTEENPPKNHREALRRWRDAKRKFEVALSAADEALNDLQNARHNVFEAAMAVHRAFIDAAARPLRHNLHNLMNIFGKKSLNPKNHQLLPDMWATLFLMTPVVSTTSVSVSRIFERIAPETLGSLLIHARGRLAQMETDPAPDR